MPDAEQPEVDPAGDEADEGRVSDAGAPSRAGAAEDAATSKRTIADERLAAAGDEHRDELPEDLDAEGYVGPYLFPNNNRRRVPGYLYLMVAAALLVTWGVTLGHHPVLVNGGFVLAAVLLAAVGAYHLAAGWNLDVDERDALARASAVVGFAVGHASAQMGWRGWLSRPTWRILIYSAENPPERRGLVLVDGVDGEVVNWFVEGNPEDWSDLDGRLDAPG